MGSFCFAIWGTTPLLKLPSWLRGFFLGQNRHFHEMVKDFSKKHGSPENTPEENHRLQTIIWMFPKIGVPPNHPFW